MDDGLSVTTVNQRHVKSGELIFEDNFDTLNFTTWQHERTLSGGGVSLLFSSFKHGQMR